MCLVRETNFKTMERQQDIMHYLPVLPRTKKRDFFLSKSLEYCEKKYIHWFYSSVWHEYYRVHIELTVRFKGINEKRD